MLLHSLVKINLTKPLIHVEQLSVNGQSTMLTTKNLLNHFGINPGKITVPEILCCDV